MKLASLELITEIVAIPGFDNIELATVSGYKTVVPKNIYKVKDVVIYVAIDTVLPKTDKFESFRKYSKKRVKTARIGNKDLGYVWSQGLVLTLYEFLPSHICSPVGTEVSHLLGITRFEEPITQELNAKGNLPLGIPKTDEERYQNIEVDKYYGELVDVTLKIDGTSFTAYYDLRTDTFGICGRTLEYKLDCSNKYTQIAKKYDLANKLKQYCTIHNVSLAIRGEIYGGGIQNNKYNPHRNLPLDVAFYSVYNIEENRYEYRLSDYYFAYLCFFLDLPAIPTIECNVLLTKELIEYYENLETIDNNYFEGVVIKTDKTSFKVINKYYDMLK